MEENLLLFRVLNDHKAQALCSNMQSQSREQWHERSWHLECMNGRAPSATRGPCKAVWKYFMDKGIVMTTVILLARSIQIMGKFHAAKFIFDILLTVSWTVGCWKTTQKASVLREREHPPPAIKLSSFSRNRSTAQISWEASEQKE